MALMMNTTLPNGLVANNAYWRLNSFEQLPNRQADGTYSVPVIALFRAFVSEAAFKANIPSIDELHVSFTPSSISANFANEAYAAFKAYDPTVAAQGAIDASHANLIEINGHLETLNASLGTKEEEIAKLRGDDAATDSPGGPLFASKLGQLNADKAALAKQIDSIENQSVELMKKIIPAQQQDLAVAQALLDELKTAVNV